MLVWFWVFQMCKTFWRSTRYGAFPGAGGLGTKKAGCIPTSVQKVHFFCLHLVTCTSGWNLELLACPAWQNLGLWRRFRLDSSTCIHLKAFLKPNRPVNLRVISYINTYKYEAKQQGTVFKSSIKVRNSCAWVPQGCEGQTGVWSTCGKFIKRPWHLENKSTGKRWKRHETVRLIDDAPSVLAQEIRWKARPDWSWWPVCQTAGPAASSAEIRGTGLPARPNCLT